MRSKATWPVATRFVAGGVLLAGWVSSAGVAGADPEPAPSPDPGPPPAPLTTIDHDGTYLVGTEILPGTYSSAGPVENGTCYWKRMGNPDGQLIDNAISKKPQVVNIEPTDKAFKTDGCQPWQNTGAPGGAPGELPGPIAGAKLHIDLGVLNGLLAQAGAGQIPPP
ncbi:hypothetical protein [Mycobacterium sp.]|uniref:hypothetical protein n=1 Tax=Mycobacterium sp. TaxID=1785 RepID=UPI003BAB554C